MIVNIFLDALNIVLLIEKKWLRTYKSRKELPYLQG